MVRRHNVNKTELGEEIAGRLKRAVEALNMFPDGPRGEIWVALAELARERPEAANVGAALMADAINKSTAGIIQFATGVGMFGVQLDFGDGTKGARMMKFLGEDGRGWILEPLEQALMLLSFAMPLLAIAALLA